MDVTPDAFRVPPPMNVPAMLFGQPEYADPDGDPREHLAYPGRAA